MDNRTIIKIINQIISISDCNKEFLDDSYGASKSFGIGETNISFNGIEKVSIFQKNLDKLYQSNKEVAATISLKTFEENFIKLLRQWKNDSIPPNIDHFNELINTFLKLEIKESEIFYELYGLEMESPNHNLGQFKIYNFNKTEEKLYMDYPHLLKKKLFFDNRNSDFFLSIKVSARENRKAVEIGDNYIKSFENVMNYMIADLKNERNIGSFNHREWRSYNRILLTEKSVGFSGNRKLTFPENIEDPYFIDSSQGNDKIWFLITKKDKNEIEKRILQSIEWIGKGVYDNDLSKSLVQFVFAIEAMLKYDEKSAISPSIVSQLSEWLAFIIEKDFEKRKELAKYFKDVYRKRSSIVHGGENSVDIKDVQLALKTSKRLIYSLMVKKPFNSFKNMKELFEYINELKFQ
ncbi:HEPN domain-containing protein [Gillisia sp. CAL575]|uniref:HEPN domain-containing protein n=1 Tax=Gillisia sp. CAL575 TaxID=985255 RepID=UPI0003A064BA|nr:HEPN domain-containing protein [Gillisia sp. CAL575]